MQFGVFLPTMPCWYRPGPVHTAVEEVALAAEALGFASVWANDAVIHPPGFPHAEGVIEPFVTLASLIHLVPRLHLGISTLVLPQRNAIIVAKQAAALDLLSQGRFILGVGVGTREEDFAFLGADFAHRGAIMDESIALLRTLWREPRVDFQGPTYALTDAVFEPKPLRGDLPIWIGGKSAAAARRAAQLGEAWLPNNLGLDAFRAGVATIQAHAAGGRRPLIAGWFGIRVDAASKQTPIDDPFLAGLVSRGIAGTPETIVERLEAYRQAGLEYVVCVFAGNRVDNMVQQMQVFAEQVMPQFVGA
jgi:probable F420-dependent oxidoreductase